MTNTIEDILANARHPENLRFGICRQYDPDDGFDRLDVWRDDERFIIMDVLCTKSRGVCWARNRVQQFYDGETYTLQIDSHMRFAHHWDQALIDMMTQLHHRGISKPLLTSYAPPFNPDNDPAGRGRDPCRMVFDRFIPEGAVFFLPESIPNWRELESPIPARFDSAHMAFTLGEFSIEVQHNPEYYFHGEEISIAVRAFTHGYDLFHPHRIVMWHEYTRKGRQKHWDDDSSWGERNTKSHLTNRKLFGMDGEKQQGHDGRYGFGKERSLSDYEEYAGIRFENRSVQQYTLDKKDPPNPGVSAYGSESEWKKSFVSIFKHCIDIPLSSLTEKDYDFWAVAFHGKNGETMYRLDADRDEIEQLVNSPDGVCRIWRTFHAEKKPSYWVVWPHSESKGWLERFTGTL